MKTNRNLRARDIALAGGIKRKNDDVWMVPSSDGQTSYYVLNWGDSMKCNCKDHKSRKLKCKHIKAVEFLILKEKFGDLIG